MGILEEKMVKTSEGEDFGVAVVEDETRCSGEDRGGDAFGTCG